MELSLSRVIEISENDSRRLDFYTKGNHFIQLIKFGDKYIVKFDSGIIDRTYPQDTVKFRHYMELTITVDFIDGLLRQDIIDQGGEYYEQESVKEIVNVVFRYYTSPHYFYDDECMDVICYANVYVSRDRETFECKYERMFIDDHFKTSKSAASKITE